MSPANILTVPPSSPISLPWQISGRHATARQQHWQQHRVRTRVNLGLGRPEPHLSLLAKELGSCVCGTQQPSSQTILSLSPPDLCKKPPCHNPPNHTPSRTPTSWPCILPPTPRLAAASGRPRHPCDHAARPATFFNGQGGGGMGAFGDELEIRPVDDVSRLSNC